MPKETVFLVDGTALCYRAYFAVKLSNSKGFPTGAVYGFYNILRKISNRYKPEYMAMCFDVSRKTFRQDKFKDYKIQRPPTPDALCCQIPSIKNLTKAMGITVVEQEGYEADDVIASLARIASSQGNDVVVVTSDKDMYQLLEDERVKVYNPGKEQMSAKQDFIKEFGFQPQQIVDFLALTGDSTDNVPGAKGIGKVTAAKLIAEFGTIEKVFANLANIPARTRDLLESSRQDILLSKELVTLVDCPPTAAWDDLKIAAPDQEELRRIFTDMEFKSLVRELPGDCPAADIKVQSGAPEASESAAFFCQDDFIYFCTQAGQVSKVSLEQGKKILLDEKSEKITRGLKRQLEALNGAGVAGRIFDVEIAAYLIDPAAGDYSLESLVAQYLKTSAAQVPPENAAHFIFCLYEKLSVLLKADGLDKLFYDVEMPLAKVLFNMQAWGIKIDLKQMDFLLRHVDQHLDAAEKQVFVAAGKEFNLNSPKQLAVVLFEEMKIPPARKTKTGYSTDEETLAKLARKYKIAADILEYRHLSKLKGTYILPLVEEVNKGNGRLHAQFNQTVTQTGRLSGSNPNLQSIPTKGELAGQLRAAFVPSLADGYIVSGDYSQIELRILAHFSQDQKLMEAFRQGVDIHSFTASLLYDTGVESVEPKQREAAKRVNFGIVYGMSAYGLAQELEVSVPEAEVFIAQYFQRYPGVKRYIDLICDQAQTQGAVRTILGRKRDLADIKSPQSQMRDFARRQAINTPIQGSSADMIKVAMINIDREFKKYKLRSRMIMQIHDELVFDVTADELERVVDIVKSKMENSVTLSVPVEVEMLAGKNWGQMLEIHCAKV